MPISRLSLALDKGLLSLPDRPVGIWNAPEGFDLSDYLSGAELRLSQSFAPLYEAFRARGHTISPTPEGEVEASVIYCHRAREATFDLMACAMALTPPGNLIVLEGDKTDGIDSAIKALKPFAPDLQTYAKAHGKLAWFANPGAAPDNWHSTWRSIEGGFQTWPGIFSSDGIDTGSRLLATNLPKLKGTIADLGAGWGYLSHTALANNPDITAATLIEADFHAAEAARRNVTDPRAQVQWGDVHSHDGTYDTILCNPPFHTSRKPDPEIGRAFLTTAARLLAPKGQLICVANRTLPYETTLAELFRKVTPEAQSAGFKVLHASYPSSPKQARTARHSRVS